MDDKQLEFDFEEKIPSFDDMKTSIANEISSYSMSYVSSTSTTNDNVVALVYPSSASNDVYIHWST